MNVVFKAFTFSDAFDFNVSTVSRTLLFNVFTVSTAFVFVSVTLSITEFFSLLNSSFTLVFNLVTISPIFFPTFEKISLTLFHVFFQSTLNTPVKNLIIPFNASSKIPTAVPMPPKTLSANSNTFLITGITIGTSVSISH